MFASLPLPLLLLGVVAAAAATIAGLSNRRAIYVLIGAMFMASTLSVATTTIGTPIKTIIYPIQNIRSELFLFLGMLVGVAALGHAGWISIRQKSPQALILLMMAVYGALLRVMHEGPGDGVQSLVFGVFTIATLYVTLPALLDNTNDCRTLLRTLIIANMIWIGIAILQLGLDPGIMTKGKQGRFLGLLGNAQHAAVYLGVMAALAFWMFLNDTKKSWKILYAVLLGLDVAFLAWTGSRTGAAMFAMGTAVAMYGRLGRSILLLPLAVIAVLVMLQVGEALGIELSTAERLTSLEDTRSHAWMTMIRNGAQNPMFGVGISAAGDSENSYFYAFAAYGIGMVALIFTLLLATLLTCAKLFRLRRHVGRNQKSLIDLVIGYNVMYFSGAVLEGYMMARVSGSLVLFVVFGSLATRILQMAAEGEPSLFEDENVGAEYEDDEEWDEPADDAYGDYEDYGDFEDYGEVQPA